MAKVDTKTALQLIQKDLDLPVDNGNLSETPDLTQLHNYLTLRVRELLDSGFDRLLNALYRIDVSEKKVAETINLEDPDKIAPKLATLIIERELQKVETRKKFSSSRE